MLDREDLKKRVRGFLDNLYEVSNGKTVSVKEQSFSDLFFKNGISNTSNPPRRKIVMDILEKNSLLLIDGTRTGIKYRWVGNGYNLDELTTQIMEEFAVNESLIRKSSTPVANNVVAKKQKIVLKNRFSLDDYAYILYDGNIVRVNIVGMWFNLDKTSTTYRVTDGSQFMEELSSNFLFHSVNDLVEYLKNRLTDNFIRIKSKQT
jgi:hypothetical protein